MLDASLPLFLPYDPVVFCIGPRRPNHRYLIKLGLFTLGVTVGVFHGALNYQTSLNGWVGRTVAHLETEEAHKRVPGTFVDSVSFTSLLGAEDAWSMGNAAAAARQWLTHTAQPDGRQDLQVAGWALRAALKSDEPGLLTASINRWNQVRRALPADLQASTPELDVTQRFGPAIYKALSYGSRDAKVAYESWLDREPVTAETVATLRLCNVSAGCTPALPVAWKTIDEQVTAQIRSWKNRGFTPQMAWDLYRERQMLGDSAHEISSRYHQNLSNPEEFRLTMQQRLARVQTPSDLPAYWAAWKDQAQRMGAPLAWEGESGVIGGLWGLKVTWASRLAGKGSGWPVFDTVNKVSHKNAQGQSDEATHWEMLEDMLASHLRAQPVGTVPDQLTAADADKRLLQAVQQAGLRQLRWPAVFPNTPEVKWRLAGLIEKGNQSLQAATQWEGPVLGQAGHVVLSLSASASGVQQGITTLIPSSPSAQRNVMISTVIAGDSLGGLPHEWFHAHDALLGVQESLSHPSWASDQAHDSLDMPMKTFWMMTRPHFTSEAPEEAMAELWESIRSPDLLPDQRINAVLEGWVDRWTAFEPEYRVQWLGDAADVRQKRWTAERSQARWGKKSPSETAQNELRTLVAQSLRSTVFRTEQSDLSTSEWIQSSQSAKPLSLDNVSVKAETLYWSLPTELLARSFERQLANQGVVSTRGETAWVYYPQGAEKAWQTPVWRQYFEKQKPWWNQLRTEAVALPLGRTRGHVSRQSTGGTPSSR